MLCLHGARVGKEEAEKFLLSWRLTAVIGRCMHSCTHKTHDVRENSQRKLLNTYTDTALPAWQQGELVKLS